LTRSGLQSGLWSENYCVWFLYLYIKTANQITASNKYSVLIGRVQKYIVTLSDLFCFNHIDMFGIKPVSHRFSINLRFYVDSAYYIVIYLCCLTNYELKVSSNVSWWNTTKENQHINGIDVQDSPPLYSHTLLLRPPEQQRGYDQIFHIQISRIQRAPKLVLLSSNTNME